MGYMDKYDDLRKKFRKSKYYEHSGRLWPVRLYRHVDRAAADAIVNKALRGDRRRGDRKYIRMYKDMLNNKELMSSGKHSHRLDPNKLKRYEQLANKRREILDKRESIMKANGRSGKFKQKLGRTIGWMSAGYAWPTQPVYKYIGGELGARAHHSKLLRQAKKKDSGYREIHKELKKLRKDVRLNRPHHRRIKRRDYWLNHIDTSDHNKEYKVTQLGGYQS